MNKPENNTIIDDHRNMLMFSKNVSQFQINNLNAWPSIFFDGAKEVKISYDFIDASGLFYSGKVIFDVTLDNTDKVDAGFKYLSAATKLLFWEQTEVVLIVNGEVCQPM